MRNDEFPQMRLVHALGARVAQFGLGSYGNSSGNVKMRFPALNQPVAP